MRKMKGMAAYWMLPALITASRLTVGLLYSIASAGHTDDSAESAMIATRKEVDVATDASSPSSRRAEQRAKPFHSEEEQHYKNNAPDNTDPI